MGGARLVGSMVAACALAALCGPLAGRALGSPPRAIEVHGAVTGCPSVPVVAGALRALWPGVRVSTGSPRVPGAPVERGAVGAVLVEIEDLGASFRVRVDGRQRTFEEPRRRCAERAKTTTVFAALTLSPPSIEIPVESRPSWPPRDDEPRSMPAIAPPPKPAPPAATPVRVVLVVQPVPAAPAAVVSSSPAAAMEMPEPLAALPPPPPGAPLSVQVDLGLREDAASSAGSMIGADAGVTLAGRLLGVALRAAYETPSTLRFGRASVRLSRQPVDAAVALRPRRGPLIATAELGVEAAFIDVQGLDLATTAGGTRVDLAAFAALRLDLMIGRRVAPFVAVHAALSPRPYEIATRPQGVIGTLPALFFGGTAGVAVVFP